LSLDRGDRDALHEVLLTRLSGLGDVYLTLKKGDGADAQRMWRRWQMDVRLLDDLGWDRETEIEHFQLTMPAETLRPVIEGIYWESVAGLSQTEDDLIDEAQKNLRAVVALCSSLLARIVQSDGSFAAPHVSSEEISGLADKVAELAESIKKG
jgi:hypothetical protein